MGLRLGPLTDSLPAHLPPVSCQSTPPSPTHLPCALLFFLWLERWQMTRSSSYLICLPPPYPPVPSRPAQPCRRCHHVAVNLRSGRKHAKGLTLPPADLLNAHQQVSCSQSLPARRLVISVRWHPRRTPGMPLPSKTLFRGWALTRDTCLLKPLDKSTLCSSNLKEGQLSVRLAWPCAQKTNCRSHMASISGYDKLAATADKCTASNTVAGGCHHLAWELNK